MAVVHGALPRSFDWVLKRQDSRKWGRQGAFEGRGRKAEGESKSRLFHVRYEI